MWPFKKKEEYPLEMLQDIAALPIKMTYRNYAQKNEIATVIYSDDKGNRVQFTRQGPNSWALEIFGGLSKKAYIFAELEGVARHILYKARTEKDEYKEWDRIISNNGEKEGQ